MSETENAGLEAGADETLFNDVISGPATIPEPEVIAPAPTEQPVVPAQQAEPAIPPGVLREAKEAARAAERRASELEARLDAFMRQQQPKQEPRQRTDVFENPSAFVQEEVSPHLSQLQAELIRTRETYSQLFAEQKHGAEKVQAAFNWIKDGLAQQDPEIIQTYQRAMQTANPYDVITREHLKRQTLSEIGDDLPSYRNRVLEEAMKDPAFQAKVIEATRQQAQQSGQTIVRPVSSLPSITKVGAAALPAGQDADMSDAELFAAATRRKRG